MAVHVTKNVYRVSVDQNNPNYYIPASIGESKGDLIVFRGEGDPVHFPSGTVADKVPVTDPSSETGWTLKSYSGGGGGGGSTSLTVTLKNNSGATIPAGAVVVLDPEGGEREIKKAVSTDTGTLFITSDNVATGSDAECYCLPNSICNVLCTSDAVSVGDKLVVSTTSGHAEAGDANTIGIALTAKASGSTGLVKVLLNCYDASQAISQMITISTTDLTDGVSPLASGALYFYYEAPEEEEGEGE